MTEIDQDRNTTSLVVGQVVEALRQEKSGQINVNILIQQVSEKAQNPQEIIVETERALELAKKWQDTSLQAFRDRVAAVVEAKLTDPDEIEKRHNNKARRRLKYLIGVIALIGLAGGIGTAAAAGNIIVVTLLLLIGAVAVAMLGPLASGESVSASDIVQILQATGNLLPGKKTEPQQAQGKQKPRR
jgi:hypothetical protein